MPGGISGWISRNGSGGTAARSGLSGSAAGRSAVGTGSGPAGLGAGAVTVTTRSEAPAAVGNDEQTATGIARGARGRIPGKSDRPIGLARIQAQGRPAGLSSQEP